MFAFFKRPKLGAVPVAPPARLPAVLPDVRKLSTARSVSGCPESPVVEILPPLPKPDRPGATMVVVINIRL